MGDKGLGVIIRTILSNDVKDIEMQIKQLSGKIKERLELRLKINAEDLKVITKEVEKVQQKVNAVIKNQNIKLDTSNIAPNIDKVTQKYTQMAGQSQKLVQETTQYVNQLGQAVKVVDTIDKETQHTVKSTQLITENYKAQRTEAEKLAMFQQKMLGFGGLKGELDIFSEKFKGKYDESALAKLRKDIESLTPSTANLNKKMKESSTAFSLLKQDAAESGNVLTRTFENAYKFLRFYLVGGLLVRFVSTIREGINTVKELDEAITNMRITMNLSSGEFDRMALSAQKLAKELGSTVAEVLEASKTFANMNETIDAIIEKTRANIILGNLTGRSVEETTDAVQGIMNQFELLEEDSMRIADTLTYISANLAMDFSKGVIEMTDAIKASGSMAREAGFSLERYESVLGSIIEKTRLPGSSVGRGLRMIIARLGRVKDPEMATDEDISQTEKAYRSIGIAIRDMTGEFREVPAVLDDLNVVWGNLTSTQRSYIAEISAGVRQKNVFMNMMDSWTRSTELNNQALEANGFAMERNAIFMDSIAGRTKQLTSTMEIFWQRFIEQDTIKEFISGLDAIMTTLDRLLNNQVASFIFQVGILTLAITLLGKGMSGLGVKFVSYVAGVKSAEIATLTFTGAVKTLSAALWASPLFKVALATAAVYSFVKIIDAVTVSFEEQKEKVDELNTKLTSLNSEYEKLKAVEDKTDEQNKYLGLLKKEIDNQEKLLKIETERLMQREFFDTPTTFSNFSPGFDKSGIKITEDYIQSLKKLRDEFSDADSLEAREKLNEQILKIEKSLIESQKSLLNYKDTLGELPPELEELIVKLEKLLIETDDLTDSQKNNSNVTEDNKKSLEVLKEEYEALEKAAKDLEDTNYLSEESIKTLSSLFVDFEGVTKLSKDGIIDFVNTHKTGIETFVKNEILATDELIKQTKDRITAYQTELLAISNLAKMRMFEKEIYADRAKLLELEIQRNKMAGFLGTIGFEKTKSTATTSPYSSKLTLSYRDIQIAIENVGFELDKLKEKEKSLSGTDLINNLQQQNDLITQRIKLLEELNWRYGEDLPRLKIQLLELGFEYENIESQADKYNALSDAQKEKVDILVKSIDDLTDSYMKNSLEILQNKNDLYSLAEAVKKVNEEIEKAEKERLDNLSSVEEELVKIRKHNLKKKLDALEESHKKELDILKERHDKTIQSYDDDLKEFERYINEKLGLLEDQYAEEDFLEQLAKEREKANEIQRQINELSLDDSLEARTRVVELTQELADQEEVINKLKNERERNLRKDNLNQQLDDYKDHIEDLKNRENNRYEHRVSSLEREYKKHKETLEKELTNERLYAEARRQLTEDNLDDIMDLFDKFHKETGKGWSLLGDTIKNEFINKLIDAKNALEDLNNIDIGGKFPKGGSGGGGSTSQSEIERISREHNVDMGVAKDMAKTNERLGYKKYHEGGFIGGKALDPRHEEIAKMLKGELALTPIDLNNFGRNLLNFLPRVTIPQLSTSSSSTTIDASININGNVDGRFKPQLIQAQDNQIRKIMNIVSKNGSITTIKRK